ncbi:MAG: chemotaxis protein CheX [Rubrivivax sp.]|nr:MAG: chemotaxis protein CheX [Rubrivivax sp.]
MSDPKTLVSKVLVLDGQPECSERIKNFCEENNLVGVKAQEDNVMGILKSNVDLGGILLWENYGGHPSGGLAYAREIHAIRPELPIFLRRDKLETLEGLSEQDGKLFYAAYTVEGIAKLGNIVKESIFSLVYPNALVRGITEITRASLESQFKEITVEFEAPYIVRDRIIYGELFSLIPLESTWCRGYMMLQTEESPLMAFVKNEKTYIHADGAGFRDINNVLGEATNLIWGAFKNRFVSSEKNTGHVTQVPIIVNHLNHYISFGSEDPQLCFKYTLVDQNDASQSIVIYQRFVFNLNWSPDNFSENETSVEDLFDSGELELF